ncbi:hypothetical protein [Streptomyces sp. T028]|uniref:hypothetical protein n=1 Tax=Streptomyces sp. T028 TaxID=3394379 RepID=UPI003A8A0DE0
MTVHTLKRRISALGTVLGLGIALPFAVGATPAYAQAQLDITKTHAGAFTRGGQGFYQIAVTNSGDQPTAGVTHMTDIFPPGLTWRGHSAFSTGDFSFSCNVNPSRTQLDCDTSTLDPGEGYTMVVTVDVAQNAPCAVTNTATVIDDDGVLRDSASDPTTIPGPDCNGGNGGNGGGGSILPVNLNGVIPMYNNITTNNNIDSPGAANVSNQDFSVEAP